jgi:hypothetical protein
LKRVKEVSRRSTAGSNAAGVVEKDIIAPLVKFFGNVWECHLFDTVELLKIGEPSLFKSKGNRCLHTPCDMIIAGAGPSSTV